MIKLNKINQILKRKLIFINFLIHKLKIFILFFCREHRDQGLTRPKVLIIVPFKKYAFKIVQMIISLLMRKGEEYITNKKRFYEEFSDKNVDKKEVKSEKVDIISGGKL
jgi:hypothetical protein